MSTDRWMDKEVAYKKELNLAICVNLDEPWGYYPKWNKSKTNTIWYHLYVESKTK